MKSMQFTKNNNTYKIYNADSYEFLLNTDFKCNLAIIDPPYILNVPTKRSKTTNIITKRNKKRLLDIKNMSNGFDIKILDLISRKQEKTNIFSFCSEKQVFELLKYAEDKNLLYNILIWYKKNPIPTINNTFMPDTEYIIYMRERGVKINLNYELARKIYISNINTTDKKKYGHPTIKPIELINKLVQIGSNSGDTILDCFMGSGTTGVSAIKNKMSFIGIEIEQKYFDISLKRIKNEVEQYNYSDYIQIGGKNE